MEDRGDEEARAAAANQPAGRRPLVIPPNQSKLLNQIRISLSHLNRDKDLQATAKSTSDKQELTKSTPNLFDQKENNLSTKANQTGYKHKEMQKIRRDLQSFQIAGGEEVSYTNDELVNGYFQEKNSEVVLNQLLQMGYDEVEIYCMLCMFSVRCCVSGFRQCLYIT